MIKRFNEIVWSKEKPSNQHDIWFDGDSFKIFINGDWKYIGSGFHSEILKKLVEVQSRLDLIANFATNGYLTMVALEDGFTATLINNNCYYRIDDREWTFLEADTATPEINAGQKIAFKANITPNENIGVGTFGTSKKCNILGTPMSLIYGDEYINDFVPECAFYMLFSYTQAVEVNPNLLPATKLSKGCYKGMFSGCSTLKNAPKLPALELAEECYMGMFYNCSNLTSCYDLPALVLSEKCYASMFACSGLTSAPNIAATKLAKYCCTSMFQFCGLLTSPVELHAIELADYCYEYMFHECANLNYIKAMFKTTPSDRYTKGWVNNVSPTGTFVKNKDATWNVIGVNGVPENWDIILN